MKKKSLLLYGVFLGALTLSSCSNGVDRKQTVDSCMSMEKANEVLHYYETSLKVLKDLVNEDDIKTVLGSLDKQEGTDSLLAIPSPVFLAQDTMLVAHPGAFFNEEERQNLADNYTRLFRSVNAFYENYEIYRVYMQQKNYKLDDYALSDRVRKEALLLSIAMSEYKQGIFDILNPLVEGAKTSLTAIKAVKAK